MNKENVLSLIIQQLESDIAVAEQAVAVARDTATHKDCLGLSKYETMGTEASYLAQGQGVRLLELERALAYFKQLQFTPSDTISLSSITVLDDGQGKKKYYFLAADAGGLTVSHENQNITIITPQSPLGRALIGKQAGDEVVLNLAGKHTSYIIEDVS
ncbi:MAG: GreA/GreB family elongation factor [Ghiorsea sp.]